MRREATQNYCKKYVFRPMAVMQSATADSARRLNWRLTQFVRVDNVGDRDYTGAVIVNQVSGRYYEPAPGRNWLAGITASFAL